LYYNTFGDYRPTGIFYVTLPSLLLFGRTEFAVRFPSALLGALSVFPLYLFVSEFTKKKGQLPLISSFLLAISPWHIEVSRATSEVVISMFFALFSLYFLLKTIHAQKGNYALLSSFFIGISYLFYHSIRFLAPLFFLTTILFYFRQIRVSKNKKFVYGTLVFVLFLTLLFSMTAESRKRFNQVSILSDMDTTYEIQRLRSENTSTNFLKNTFDSKYVVFTRRFLTEYASYFSPDFLIGNNAKPYRYSTPGSGLITYFEFVLLLIGLAQIAKGKKSFLPLALLLIAPLPASITTEDTPNLHRSLLMVPFLTIIEGYGLLALLQLKKHFNFLKVGTFAFLILNFSLFLYMYFAHSLFHKPFIKDYVLDASSYRNVGTKELILKLEQIKGNYEKIVVTSFPDSPYPWYAFFTNKDPGQFNKFAIKRTEGPWQYQNIVFSEHKCPSDNYFLTEKEEKLLVVDSGVPYCPYESKITDGLEIKVVDKIPGPAGSEAYALLERK
jgi:4-amino-4-deoxy-L-arabinose transferase-like glycosyltransferase